MRDKHACLCAPCLCYYSHRERRRFLCSVDFYGTCRQVKLIFSGVFFQVAQQAVVGHVHRGSSSQDVLNGASGILHEELTKETKKAGLLNWNSSTSCSGAIFSIQNIWTRNRLLTMLKTAITRMRAVVVMVRTNRSQGLLVTMMREEVGNQVGEQKDPFLPCWGCKETGGRIRAGRKRDKRYLCVICDASVPNKRSTASPRWRL